MLENHTTPRSSGSDLRVKLSEMELKEIDSWITERPDPRPTREEAAQFFLMLGLSNNQTLKAIMGFSYSTDAEIYAQMECDWEKIDITRGVFYAPEHNRFYLKF